VSHPDGLPELFLDRSLGRIQVPALLRAAGLRLVTLAERYGIHADEGIPDEQWLADAGQRREVVLMKDTRVRYNAPEKLVVVQHRVRCFCLTRQDLDGTAMAARFLDNLNAIVTACAEEGPFIYAVHAKSLRRLPG